MYPQEQIAYYKRLLRPILCYQKYWATLLHFCYHYYLLLVTNYLAIKLLVTDNFSACRKYLPKTAYHFLLLLIGFDTLTYQKDYD